MRLHLSMNGIELLKREIETTGELLNQESLDRKTEIAHIKIQLMSIRLALTELLPEFDRTFQRLHRDILQQCDPDRLIEEDIEAAGKKVKPTPPPPLSGGKKAG